ncbi:MAG: AmmeMemoRadiSam system radical SAM enzyme [Chloroflexi bacterium]|nr:AmmeMemoRadiSam system radical SAM enzyme [Chloroflexota bacterium]
MSRPPLPTKADSESLREQLDAHTMSGELVQPLERGRVRCVACGHRCLIPPGARGICKVRFNDAGTLRVPTGYVSGLQVDPVEKKPFFHVLPGSRALSFGMLGCDFHCGYCQNWVTSQSLRDEAAGSALLDVTPDAIVEAAIERDCALVVSTYNEPLITIEWAVQVFRRAREAGLKTAFVSNGNATAEALDYVQPWVDAYKVDLKSMNDKTYRQLGGVRDHVLDTIQSLHERGVWLEVVTLVVPGFNDDAQELREAAEFLAAISRDIPWHVTAFHPDYRMQETPPTNAASLLRAVEYGQQAGLRYLYPGNLPGQVGSGEDTLCAACGKMLVRRVGFEVLEDRIGAGGVCDGCGATVPGVWV